LFEIRASNGELAFIDASVAGEYEVFITCTAPFAGGSNRFMVYVTVSA